MCLLKGVSHGGAAKDFQLEMCSYMPRTHAEMAKDFIAHVERSGTVRSHIVKGNASQEVESAFTECVKALGDLRSFHLNAATTYLTKTGTGTGSSAFRVLLKEIIDNTQAAFIARP